MYKSSDRTVRILSKNDDKGSEKVGGKVMKWFPTATVFFKKKSGTIKLTRFLELWSCAIKKKCI